ncbi:MAG: hypothetical protein LUD15_14940, partial [Bacteroides sp.]|nr:hypothetical protein [Bacteroides sp.]
LISLLNEKYIFAVSYCRIFIHNQQLIPETAENEFTEKRYAKVRTTEMAKRPGNYKHDYEQNTNITFNVAPGYSLYGAERVSGKRKSYGWNGS